MTRPTKARPASAGPCVHFALACGISCWALLAGCTTTAVTPPADPLAPSNLPVSAQELALAADSNFWVSPRGDDRNPGTEAAPFRTLSRVRDAARERLRQKPLANDLVITLRGGTYRLSETLTLDDRDAGRDGWDVVWRSAPHETAVISGAIPVTGWTRQPNTPLYRTTVGPRATRHLYVNGRRATRARTSDYPEGFRPADATPDFAPPYRAGIEFLLAEGNPVAWRDPARWTNPSDIEAVIVTQWKMMRVPLTSVTPAGPTGSGQLGLLHLASPAWANANVFFSAKPYGPSIWSFWQVTWFENAFEFLDQAGEWYLDRPSGALYYYPREGEDLAVAQVELPIVETLIQGWGTAEQPFAHVRFEGLVFQGATWLGPSGEQGYVSDQSGFLLEGPNHAPNVVGHDPQDVRTPGNLSFRYAHEVEFRGNVFERLGAVGLDFGRGSQNNTIVENLFEDLSAAAIQLGGIEVEDHHPSDVRSIVSGNVISDNLILSIGREYYDAAGIFLGFTQNSTVDHNTIVDVPWSGIAIGWGWGLLDPGSFPGLPGAQSGEWGNYTTPTTNRNNRIRWNRIDQFLGQVWDGGSIYTTGAQGPSLEQGLLIEGNVASGKRPKGGGNTFYTDGGTRYVTLRGNASFNNPQGVTDLGPPPRWTDPLPYSSVPSLLDGLPYGSENGGCRTYGDFRIEGNYWLPKPDTTADWIEELLAKILLHYDPYSSKGFFGVCPYEQDGVSYPTGLVYQDNHETHGHRDDIPVEILNKAGYRLRPATIPAARWQQPFAEK